jgi:hypothetical protein
MESDKHRKQMLEKAAQEAEQLLNQFKEKGYSTAFAVCVLGTAMLGVERMLYGFPPHNTIAKVPLGSILDAALRTSVEQDREN